ncbi:hypothetical protein ABMX48_31655 [Streptomyces cavourensis]
MEAATGIDPDAVTKLQSDPNVSFPTRTGGAPVSSAYEAAVSTTKYSECWCGSGFTPSQIETEVSNPVNSPRRLRCTASASRFVAASICT